MPRFKSKCPFCTDNDWIEWKHSECPDSYGENIDIEGYITCNYCNKKMDLLTMDFYCKTNQEYRVFNRKMQIRTLIALICKIDNIDDDFLDTLQDNLINRWDRTH